MRLRWQSVTDLCSFVAAYGPRQAGWLLLMLALTSCQSPPATVSKASFGRHDDRAIELYTLVNRNGLVAKVTNYGALLTECQVYGIGWVS